MRNEWRGEFELEQRGVKTFWNQPVLAISLSQSSVLSSEVVEHLSAQEITFERFDDGVDLPLRTAFVQEKVLDAVPPGEAVELAVGPIIEELTVLLAHIFLILLTVLDLHAFPLQLHL